MGGDVNADQILAVSLPEKIFDKSKDKAKKQFRDLAMKWHPDRCKDPRAAQVFDHVTKLHEEMETQIEIGRWGGSVEIEGRDLVTTMEARLRIKYTARRPFELGEFFITEGSVAYWLKKEHAHFADNIREVQFVYPSQRMRDEMERYLPKCSHHMEMDNGSRVVIIDKPKKHYQLREVLGAQTHLDARHVAWIMSRLYNLSCFLTFNEIVHHDISLDTVFIGPEDHSLSLLGGWWYWRKKKTDLMYVPERTFKALPWEVQQKKIALPETDLNLIVQVGRELVGKQKLPESLAMWLKCVSGGNAFEDYKLWARCLDKSFGPRRFTKMDYKP